MQPLLFASPHRRMTVPAHTDNAVKTCSGHKKRKGGLTFPRFALGCWHNSRYDGQQIRRPRNPLVTHVEVKSMSNTFSARLNRLFDTVYPPGRGPHTSAEVIAALKAEGITMSAPYLS